MASKIDCLIVCCLNSHQDSFTLNEAVSVDVTSSGLRTKS